MKFPYLDELELVYGKDRANGEIVEDYEDAVNNLEAEEKSAEATSYVNCETDDEIRISTSRTQKKQTVYLSKKPKKLKTSAAPAPHPWKLNLRCSLVAELLKLELYEGDSFIVVEILGGVPAKLNIYVYMASPAASGGLFKFLKPSLRLQSTDIQAAAMWGVAAGTTAIWLIQPFDWLKKTFFEKPEPEGNAQ
ncbi:hypothetical protein ACH5RR_019473 [Cinchona calisaya]|uniref:Uncharacterized protein n=1 Tax=Cinchona calisaya TaxID=153742 RepID=A0ABD2ZPG4_9GENT